MNVQITQQGLGRSRNRWLYVGLTCAVIALGLASRKWPLFPVALGKYPGDALYALMMFCAVGFAFPSAPILRNAAYALAWCFGVEFGQLYHAPWIDSIRATTLGHLVLGSYFGWLDLVAYVVGVIIGMACEWLWTSRRAFR
jgi:Protein of unknown function (DUF2809)